MCALKTEVPVNETSPTRRTRPDAQLTVAQVKTELEKVGITYENLKGKTEPQIRDFLLNWFSRPIADEYAKEFYRSLHTREIAPAAHMNNFNLVTNRLAELPEVKLTTTERLEKHLYAQKMVSTATATDLSVETVTALDNARKQGPDESARYRAEYLKLHPEDEKKIDNAIELLAAKTADINWAIEQNRWDLAEKAAKSTSLKELRDIAIELGHRSEFDSIMESVNATLDAAKSAVDEIQRIEMIGSSVSNLLKAAEAAVDAILEGDDEKAAKLLETAGASEAEKDVKEMREELFKGGATKETIEKVMEEEAERLEKSIGAARTR